MGSSFSDLLENDVIPEFMEDLYSSICERYNVITKPKYGTYFNHKVHKIVYENIVHKLTANYSLITELLQTLYMEYKLNRIYYLTYRLTKCRFSIVLSNMDNISIQTLGDIALKKGYTLYNDGMTYTKPLSSNYNRIIPRTIGITEVFDTDDEDYEYDDDEYVSM